MTTRFTKPVTCSRCGHASEQAVIGSTNRFGFPDLDLRPPPMERATIDAWLQDCPSCGYVASDLAAVEEDVSATVESAEYRDLADVPGPGRPRLVSAFRRRALIDAAKGNRAKAGSALLCAAWVADDARDDRTAIACRRAAAGHLVAWLDASNGSVERRLQVVDVLRRAGQFDEAAEQAAAVTDGLEAGSALAPIIAYQKKLIAARDAACHTIAEVHEGK